MIFVISSTVTDSSVVILCCAQSGIGSKEEGEGRCGEGAVFPTRPVEGGAMSTHPEQGLGATEGRRGAEGRVQERLPAVCGWPLGHSVQCAAGSQAGVLAREGQLPFTLPHWTLSPSLDFVSERQVQCMLSRVVFVTGYFAGVLIDLCRLYYDGVSIIVCKLY